ncbi:DNA-methyltransferase [Variovorax ginsengisoli]|uniref:Methyltransferase n=1 Tax=Variovorax ginsengisoli TaxID=363844 RepID=A0ABT8S073_9BURK|nr:site-specific DNA-methyltransferase [Variovorax ginsengisoli]MDN8612763.1 site-specific DNA-methyltransferase [Variovorax ginsengisoli]MDO1531933.1 site-specific DNA-methyltransferase [Variovorax ginsengisoli]
MSAASDWLNRCHFGDVRAVLRRMAADGVKVQTIVTSPPYWGLRSYLPAEHVDKSMEIGGESTVPEFIAAMVQVFDLCRDVLTDDGTMWVNMGDSYAGSWGAQSREHAGKHVHSVSANQVKAAQMKASGTGNLGRTPGLKAKDLIGQPWRLAFALQDAGWWLRQDIIWHKPNPMPESIKDRCTKAHEYIFLLSKSERYYFDQGAILEPVSPLTHARLSQNVAAQLGSERANGGAKTNGALKAVGRRDSPPGKPLDGEASIQVLTSVASERNRRSVWTVPTASYSGAHFAVFPPALIEPCILAGAPAGGIVLDPFFGSGTTGQVAQQLGRQFIGIELNEANEPLQRERLRQPSLLLEAA